MATPVFHQRPLALLFTKPLFLQCSSHSLRISPYWRRPFSSHARRSQRDLERKPMPRDEANAPKLERDPKFSRLSAEHIKHFQEVLRDDSALLHDEAGSDSHELAAFNTDWMKKYHGRSQLVLLPTSTQQVSQILRYCNANKLAVVPQGGNSGLVGGSVPVFDEIILNMSRMNRIRGFDDTSGVLVVDAGVILENADTYLAERSHIFPLDLGAKGSCQIGGNIATNAGGLRLLRYGSLHGNILGLEIVLPDGIVVDDLGTLKKNNTGYDLKQLFIGGEGTIGVITAASIACPRRPNAVNVAYLGLPSYQHVQEAFKTAKAQLGEILSAFELMDGRTQDIVHQMTGNRMPLEERYPFYCLIEISGSNGEHDAAKLEAFIEHVMEKGIVSDGVIAQDQDQINTLWRWREGIVEALSKFPLRYGFDLSIPLDQFYDVVGDTRERLLSLGLLGDDAKYPVVDVMGYGHIGDGNIHLNIVARKRAVEVDNALEPWVYEWVARRKGSISAEHGLGLAKARYVGYNRDETMLRMMRQIKRLFDPKGIMNPYKYIQ